MADTTSTSTPKKEPCYMERLGTWVTDTVKSEPKVIIGWLVVILVLMIVSLIAIYGFKWATWNGFSMPSFMQSSSTPAPAAK